MNKQFVYDGIEVKLTGREAIKTTPSGKALKLVEITPADEDGPKWTKWIRPTDLFEIVEGNNGP